MDIRTADKSELDLLARLWYEGWQDAHSQILPAELARYRTLESFRDRLESDLPNLRVVGSIGQPVGFSIIKEDELYQLYVSEKARGKGVAAALLSDAELRLRARGLEVAWLACAIGNERAARFYEKNGWYHAGNMTSQLPTPDRTFPLEVWCYEKDLGEALRPLVGVAHVVLETDRMDESAQFMRTIGMRPIHNGPEVSVYEMRGGTHLILMHKNGITPGDASFDLMVDDLHGTHQRFKSMGLSPSSIETREAIDHKVFAIHEPAGNKITFFSSHLSGKPV